MSYLKPLWKEDKFKFTGKEELQGTGYIDFGARLYDNLVPRFITVDPLAEKYSSWSPLNYTLNNPILFVDPDGMGPEKPSHYIIAFTSDYWARSPSDNKIVANFNVIAQNSQDNALRFMGHGDDDHITVQKSKGVTERYKSDGVDGYLSNSEEGEKWNEMKDKGGTFISYACNTGVEGGVIDQVSGLKENANIIFVAPSTLVHPSKDTREGRVSTFDPKSTGQWNIYKGGKLIDTRPNGWQPTEIDPKTYKDVPKPPGTVEKIINMIKNFLNN